MDIVVGLVLIAVLGGAIFYILREKRKGRKCIGCPNTGNCSGKCAGCTAEKEK